MTTNDKVNPTVSRDGAVEIDEAELKQLAGGASDYLLTLEGIKGESKDRPAPPLASPTAVRL